jgi:hypothetical protein
MLFECEASSELEQDEEELRGWNQDAKKEFFEFFHVETPGLPQYSSSEEEEEEVRERPKKCPRTLVVSPVETVRYRITMMLRREAELRVEEGCIVEESLSLGRRKVNFHNRFSALRPSPLDRDFDSELGHYLERKRLVSEKYRLLLEKMANDIAIEEERGSPGQSLHISHGRVSREMLTWNQSYVEEEVPPLALEAMLRRMNGVRILRGKARGDLLLRTMVWGEFYLLIAWEFSSKALRAYIIIRRESLRL